MKKPLLSLLAIIGCVLCFVIGFAQISVNYHYWFDTDYENHTEGSINGSELALDVDVSHLPVGMHAFHIALWDDGDSISKIRTSYFIHNPNMEGQKVSFNIYIDQELFSTIECEVSKSQIPFDLNVASLSTGFHNIAIMPEKPNGTSLKPYAGIFYKAPKIDDSTVLTLSTYIDGKPFGKPKTISPKTGTIAFDLDVDSISTGLHSLAITSQTDNGFVLDTHSAIFIRTSTAAELSGYPLNIYMDNELFSTIKCDVSKKTISLDLNVDSLSIGFHNIAIMPDNPNGTSLKPYGGIFYKAPKIDDSAFFTLSTYIDGKPYGKQQTLSAKTGAIAFDLDVDSISPGLHSLAITSQTDNGFVLDTHSAIFLRTSTAAELSNITISTYIDGKPYGKQQTLSAKTGALAFDLDVDSIPIGLHSLAIISQTSKGLLLNTHSSLFLRITTQKELTDSRLLYTFDDSGIYHELAGFDNNGTIDALIDVSELEKKKHTIYFGVVSGDGSVSQLQQATFHHNLNVDFVAEHPIVKDLQINTSLTEGINLSWTAVDEEMDSIKNTALGLGYELEDLFTHIGYAIYKANDEGVFDRKINADTIFTTSYTIKDVDLTKTNVYAVQALYSDGNSELSSPVTAKKQALKPSIQYVNRQIEITSATESPFQIYYQMADNALDNPDPRNSGILYEGKFTPAANATIYALVAKDGYFDSEISAMTYNMSAYTCEKPTITINGNKVQISALDADAIYYTIDGSTPTNQSTLYQEEFMLTFNCTVKAIATKQGMFDSPVASATYSEYQAQGVAIKYDGRYVTMDPINDTQIYYTLDGTEPTKDATLYTDTFDAGGTATVKARRYKDKYNDSPIAEYEIPAYFSDDDMTVKVARPGKMDIAFNWYGNDVANIENLTVMGTINATDVALFDNSMTSLSGLDLENAQFQGDNLVVTAKHLIWTSLPRHGEINYSVQCPELAAVIWNAASAMPNTVLGTQSLSNPNLLLYVQDKTYAPATIRNVVANNTAESIVLEDFGNFYCPIDFETKEISYTHNYTMTTGISETCGWETLTLPFDVQTVTHQGMDGTTESAFKAKGEIKPFKAFDMEDYSEFKPFWLYSLNNTWQPEDKIEAYHPYLISIPNNPEYADDYILAGTVVFSAQSANVQKTQEYASQAGNYEFCSTTLRKDKSKEIMPINREGDIDNRLPGSEFIPDLRDVYPFEAYMLQTSGPTMAPLKVADLGSFGTDGLDKVLQRDDLWQVYVREGSIMIVTSHAQRVRVFTVDGRPIRIVDLKPGTNQISNLPTGFYIIKHNKVFVKQP